MKEFKKLSEIATLKIGPIEKRKEIHTPTKERFDIFCDIISKKSWFESYSYWIVGAFANTLNNNQQWVTWDVDMILVSEDNSNLKEIKEVLLELTKIALFECGFFLDVYYAKSKKGKNTPDISINNKYHFLDFVDNKNSLDIYNNPHFWTKGISDAIGKGCHIDQVLDIFHRTFCINDILSISENIYKNGKKITNWPEGKEVYEGLWQRYINFPAAKQIERTLKGLSYDKPQEIKSYYKNIKSNMYKPLPQYLAIGPSDIHGAGIFAKEDIPADMIIGITHIYDTDFEDDYIRTPLGGFVNHSKNPNCVIFEEDDNIYHRKLKTIKRIEMGQELTLEYTWYDPSEEGDFSINGRKPGTDASGEPYKE